MLVTFLKSKLFKVKPFSHNMQPTVIEDFPEPPQIPPSPPMVPTPPSKSPDLSISIVADSTGAPSSLPPAPPSPPPAPRLPQRSHSITRLDQINQDYKDFQEEMRDYRSPTPPPIPRTPSPLKVPFDILPWYHLYRFSHHPRVFVMRQFDWLYNGLKDFDFKWSWRLTRRYQRAKSKSLFLISDPRIKTEPDWESNWTRARTIVKMVLGSLIRSQK